MRQTYIRRFIILMLFVKDFQIYNKKIRDNNLMILLLCLVRFHNSLLLAKNLKFHSLIFLMLNILDLFLSNTNLRNSIYTQDHGNF